MTTAAQDGAAVGFLRSLPARLAKPSAVAVGRKALPVKPRRAVLSKIDYSCSLPIDMMNLALKRLDCNVNGSSQRTGKPAWPNSWALSTDLVKHLGAEFMLVFFLAPWLERRSESTRRTYWYQALSILSDLRIRRAEDLMNLSQEAALTWQREISRTVLGRGRPRRPRTVNLAVSVLNSLMAFVCSLDLTQRRWVPLSLSPVNRGRHQDEDSVVLESSQLLRFWQLAAGLVRRQFVALMLVSLHGLRVAEAAILRWRDLRLSRRGQRSAPAVMHVLGKGSKHRAVQIHPAMRSYLERERIDKDPDAYVLADDQGQPPTPMQISYWAKVIFRKMDLPVGYAHSLRATWATLALENKRNASLQVQMTGGWSNNETMRKHYFKRRQVPLIRLFDERG